MLNLGNVTLCGVDTRTPDLALQALKCSMRRIRFGAVILFSNSQPALCEQAAASGVKITDVGAINSIEDYSKFMVTGLADYIPTEFALVTQWDGFVLNPQAWSDEFLQYDYIGALWRDKVGDRAVGNGGFSLRSKRLFNALLGPDIVVTHPEDLCICDVNRERLERNYGIRFAPPEVAAKFSYEHVRPTTPAFGFHGIFNLVDALSADEMLAFTKEMTVGMAFGAGARQLAKSLVYSGQYEAARELLLKRIRGGDRRWRTLSLWMRMWLRQQLGIKSQSVRANS
ncbi:MAG TPA: DUF5672 family protein [Steroidobacteraceae bacterium]|nr:DUF5672 family protein [Steroidobacteraceae bacterium]